MFTYSHANCGRPKFTGQIVKISNATTLRSQEVEKSLHMHVFSGLKIVKAFRKKKLG